MESSRFDAALDELRALRKVDRDRDLSDHIKSLLAQAWTPDERSSLRGELVNELHRHGRYAEAEVELRAEIEREPAEPYHSLRLAEHFHYYEVNLSRSIALVAEAVAKGMVDGKFVYQALGTQARLAIEAQQWHLLEQTLLCLASYEHTPGDVDVFPETDFLPRIPAHKVSQAALNAYVQRVDYLRSIGYSTIEGACRDRT